MLKETQLREMKSVTFSKDYILQKQGQANVRSFLLITGAVRVIFVHSTVITCM